LENERVLVRRILEGDSEAFKHVVADHRRMVTHIVSRMVYDPADRADIAQEVFVRVYEHLDRFEHRSKLSTYVARIAYNTCLNFVAKMRPSLLEEDVQERGGMDTFAGAGPAPDTLAQRARIACILESEIAKLPLKHRAVLTLYHLEDLSYEEIADVLGIPVGTVKSYLFRARRVLRQRLGALYSREDLET
jgi:RNA polymerase sigma factor (sigma-70 family)